MKTGRQVYWFVSAFIRKYKGIMTLSFIMAILGGIFLILILPRLPKPKPYRLVGLIGRYNLSQVPAQVEYNLGIGLTARGQKLEPVPALAKSWTVSSDGKQYTFNIDLTHTWSNGTPLKISDINLSIPSVEITKGTDTITFTLPDAFAPFPSLLQKPVLKDGFLTLSQYTIKDIQTEGPYLSKITLDSNKDTIEYRFYGTTSQAVTAFKLGQIDYLLDLEEKPSISQWPNTKLDEAVDFERYVAIFFDTSDPMFGKQNKDIRQALAYAVKDKANSSVRALSPVSPLSWGYNKTVKNYDYNLERAKALFKKGWGENTQKATIELSTTPELLSFAEKVKIDWSALGIETNIKVVSGRPEQFQALLLAEPIPDDPDQYTLWHSTQKATNFTKFQDEQVDKLLEDGRRNTKQDERLKIYLDFQRFLLEESPAIFLYHPVVFSITRTGAL
jgi:ABC-type transport system substrate-binding protein